MWTWLGRPIFTPCRLIIASAFVGRHHLVAHEVAAERAAGAAGRRILGDAELRREHPAVDRGARRRPARPRTRTRRARRVSVVARAARRARAAFTTALSTALRVVSGTNRNGTPHDTTCTGRPVPATAGRRERRAPPRRAPDPAIGSPKVGSGCVIHAKPRSSPFQVSATGTGPMPRPNTNAFAAALDHAGARQRERACRWSDARPSAAPRPA